MFKKTILNALMLATMLGGTIAHAALIDITWTGTIIDGNDPLGLFGAPGLLNGAAYTSTYRYDTSIGFSTAFGTIEDVRGGTFNFGPVATPAVSASITVNGVTDNANRGYFDVYQRRSEPGFSSIITEVEGQNAVNLGAIDILFNRASRLDDLYPFGLNTPFSYTFGLGDTVNGFFQHFNAGGTIATSANLAPTSITIAPAQIPGPGTPVPAPGTLGLLGAGLLGLFGVAKGYKKCPFPPGTTVIHE